MVIKEMVKQQSRRLAIHTITNLLFLRSIVPFTFMLRSLYANMRAFVPLTTLPGELLEAHRPNSKGNKTLPARHLIRKLSIYRVFNS